MVALTIGMATYDDFDGVYFTIQALRLYQDLDDVEILVVDNYGCEHTKRFVQGWARARYIRAKELVGTAAPRDLVFRKASGEAVLCCDSHVLFFPGVIAKLKAYYRKHPKTNDLLQGPLVYDDLNSVSTHFEPVWREQMWGIWATDDRGRDPAGKPFDIPMQGLGVFSCRKDAWPGFNPLFRGFGAEEGYIHEKFRQRGGRTLCLPWLRWVHRFSRPRGVPYPLIIEDKLRNYLIGHTELGLDLEPVLEHFAQHLPPAKVAAVRERALRDLEAARAPKAKKTKKRGKRKSLTPSPSPGSGEGSLRVDELHPATPLDLNTPSPIAMGEGRGEGFSGEGELPGEAEAAAPPAERNGNAGQLLHGFIFGLSGDVDLEHPPALRTFPLFTKRPAETDESHVVRVARLVATAADAGGTHLLIPSGAADWLGDHPLVTDYLAAYHQPIAASRETGFLFALNSRDEVAGEGQAHDPADI